MSTTQLFSTKATATGGRQGKAVTEDGTLNLDFSMPGSGKPGTNPEQLFALGYAACFGGAVAAAARNKGVEVGEVKVNAEVSLNKGDDGFSVAVILDTVLEGVEQNVAADLARTAHNEICPYSKATRGNIPVTLKANGQPVE